MHKGRVIDKINKYSVIECELCQFIHLSPIPSSDELNKIYSDEYYKDEKPKYIAYNLEDKKWWETVYQDRMVNLNKFVKSKTRKMLEIGSGPGLFLKYAKKQGWDVLGIEPSKQAYEFSKRNSIPVVNSFYNETDLNSLGKFDAVVMFEFLEHVPNPQEVIQLSYSLLNKGGVICIGVPNDYNPLQEVVRKKLKLKPYWLAPPFHINYFTLYSLEKLLNNNDFKVILKETNFPMEIFLLMNYMYIGNDKVGRYIHGKRKLFDFALFQYNNDLKLKLYQKLAELNIGRDITIYGQKS